MTTINLSDPLTILRTARLRAGNRRPYFRSALLALCFIEKPGIGTLAVDKYWRMYYDPAIVAKWGVGAVSGVLLHELAHVLKKHHQRSENMGIGPEMSQLTNVAMDCEINDDLMEDLAHDKRNDGLDLELPSGDDEGVYPSKLGLPDHKLWEEYYNTLKNMVQQMQQQAGQQGQQGPFTLPQCRDCGSGAHGQPRPWDAGSPNPTPGDKDGMGSGEKKPAAEGPAPGTEPGLSEAEAEVLRKDTARSIQEHVKNRGTVPGDWQRWAEVNLTPPKVNWRKELAAVVRNCLRIVSGMVDYSYRRPSRRQSAMRDVVLPTMHRPIPRVTIVFDTSGSMGEADLAEGLNEVEGVCRATGAQVGLLSVDAAVHGREQQVLSAKQVKLSGGGGTDMCIGIMQAMEAKIRPDIVVVITDGYTPWPSEPTKCKLIVVLVGENAAAASTVPTWAKALRVADCAR